MTYKLILLRHGHSEWNAKNLFTGWVDVDLNDQGREEAARGGELLVEHEVLPDILYTSLLKRAINTANIALDKADRGWIPVKRDWRLNERHYGALQGKDKAQTLAEYGEEQFMEWRRSYDTPPPPLDDNSEFSQARDPRYADLGDDLPRTECLKDVLVRLLPYWESDIKEDLKSGKTVLVTAHGNSLRALVKHLDGISDDAIAGLNIPTGIPLVYDLDEDFQPVKPGGTYLDPEAAEQAVQPWMGERSLPLWLDDPDWYGFNARDSQAAYAAGLVPRPLAETLADTLAWELGQDADRVRGAGLPDADERALLEAWRSRLTSSPGS